jgi:hypothetical protein
VVLLILFLIMWAVGGVLNYGLALGRFTHKFPWDKHLGFVLMISFFGPLALVGFLIAFQDISHWKLKPLTVEERWTEHQRLWPNLPRKYFDAEL